jgi:methylmalonyl-CoA/ethylmalonyl-CoA epimerase
MKMRQLPLDHVAIAVPSIAGALPLYELLTGGAGSPTERVDAQGVNVAFIGHGTGRIELIEPLSDESPVARFLQRRGAGLHHLAYRVTDLARTLEQLGQAGIRLIDKEPRAGAHGSQIAFVHPESTGGVLIELVEDQGTNG